MTTKEAIEHLSKELKNDSGYWYSWQANIAVQFQDELARRGYKLPDQHDISNVAANNFMKLLTADHEGTKTEGVE